MVEKIVNTVYVTGGIILLMVVIMAMSSCGTSKCSNNKMVKQYSNW